MKKTTSFDYSMDLQGHATGIAAIGIICSNIIEKIKSIFSGSGSHGHSEIKLSGIMNVRVETSIEFTADEQAADAEVIQKLCDDMYKSKNMAQIIECSKLLGDYIKSEAPKFIVAAGDAKAVAKEQERRNRDTDEDIRDGVREDIRQTIKHGCLESQMRYSYSPKQAEIAREEWKKLFDEECPYKTKAEIEAEKEKEEE